jgi:hypothetical protein
MCDVACEARASGKAALTQLQFTCPAVPELSPLVQIFNVLRWLASAQREFLHACC